MKTKIAPEIQKKNKKSSVMNYSKTAVKNGKGKTTINRLTIGNVPPVKPEDGRKKMNTGIKKLARAMKGK